MAISKAMFDAAAAPTMHLTYDALLRQLTSEVQGAMEAALTAALVRPRALELADLLVEPLEKARAAAVEPMAAVDAARQALADEQRSIAGRLAAFWNSKKRGDPDDREREPVKDTEEVQALKAVLQDAEKAAFPYQQRVRYHELQIEGLRAAPVPDPVVLAVLAEAMVGGHRDAD